MADEEFIQNLTQQVHDLWINPEEERRACRMTSRA
jgi:hypothetical protein